MKLTQENFTEISSNKYVLALVERLLDSGDNLIATEESKGQYVCTCDIGTVRRINNREIQVPIIFNRHDFTGNTGTIRPINSSKFTIDDIEGTWEIREYKGIVTISDGEREYRGFMLFYGKAYFSECGCEREDADPRIAFAQVMHNI